MYSSGLLRWTRAVSLAMVAFFSASAFGRVWYVDDDNFNTPGTDGFTEATAFGTIQEAVNAASSDDIVMVAAGTYDQGSTPDGFAASMENRVYIDKPLTLCGEGKDVTIIKGKKASGNSSLNATARRLGLGPDAIRCIAVKADNVVISNFTITGGATCRPDGWDDANANGGGVYASGEKVVVANCVISNNVARRGGGVCHAVRTAPSLTVVRSWIHGNFAENDEPIARGCLLAFCLVTGHPHTQEPITDASVLVNCTFAGNSMRSLVNSASASVRNCLLADYWYKADESKLTDALCYSNCAFPIGQEFFVTPGMTNGACLFNAGTDHFVSPIDNDYRLHDGARNAIGKGDAAFLELIPEKYRYVDYEGNAVDPDGQIHLGCIQSVVSPVGGTIRFSGLPSLDRSGCAAFADNPTNAFLFGEKATSFAIPGLAYARALSGRVCVRVRQADVGWDGLFGFSASGSDVMTRFPLMDGTYDIMLPPAGEELVLTPVKANSVYYVDKDSEVDSGDGSASAPFKSIQTAINAVEEKKYGIVYVREGVYDNENGVSAGMHLNRVAITGRNVRLVSVDGIGKAVIPGAADPDVALESWPFGCGPKGMRSVYVGSASAVQGFSLARGHASNPSVDSTARQGGGAYLESGAQVLDCIITNNIARQGSALNGNGSGFEPAAVALRCLISDNYGIESSQSELSKENQAGSGTCRRTTLASCVFSGNHGQGFGSYERQYNYHCTMVGPGYNAKTPTVFTSTLTNVNCVIVAPKDNANKPVMLGGTADVGFGAVVLCGGAVGKDALIANPDALDFRLSALSPARNAGYASDFNGHAGDKHHSRYYVFGATDFYGSRFRLNGADLPVCGAVDRFAKTFTAANAGVSVSSPVADENGRMSVSYTAVNAGTRPYLGIAVNGETQQVVKASGKYDVSASGDYPDLFTIEALYDTNWHVDADNGDDGCWGTAASPKRTLKGALSHAVSGDTVYVASGVYSNETMTLDQEMATSQTGNFAHKTRAVVADGVALVGAGASTTFIVGESDPGAGEQAAGCGDNAVRCVALGKGASISGFTLTGGRTQCESADNAGDALCGGGILASRCKGVSPGALYSSLPRISDCVISNCVARRGGGVYNGVYNRCRLMDNKVVSGGNGSAGRGINKGYFYCYNTIIDRNEGYSTTYYARIENCTIGAGNSQDGNLDGVSIVNQSPLVLNTLILGNKGSPDGTVNVFSNCVFNADTHKYLQKITTNVIGADCIVDATDDQLQVDGNYSPVIGANLAVDAANALYSTEGLGAVDVYGNPRRVNGRRLDVGAVEVDWKAEYSRRLGRRVNVTAASPEVLSDDSVEGVQIPAGATLAATYGRVGTAGERTTIGSTVAAGGSLTVDTATWKRTLASGENQILAFKTDADFTDLEFSAVDADAVLHGIVRAIPFSVIIR